MNSDDVHIPTFISENRELWDAWREIQRRGKGEIVSISGGWRILALHTPSGDVVMRLEVTFKPTQPG